MIFFCDVFFMIFFVTNKLWHLQRLSLQVPFIVPNSLPAMAKIISSILD